MAIKCPACGHEEPEGTQYCGECGQDMLGAPATPSPQPAVQTPVQTPGAPAAPVQVQPQAAAQVAAKAKLLLKRFGASTGEEIPIMGDVLIGRSDPDTGAFVDIDLSSLPEASFVSRKHAKIYQKEGQWYIEDMGSTNGTYVNRGPRLTAPQPLKDGDEILIGKAYFIFKVG